MISAKHNNKHQNPPRAATLHHCTIPSIQDTIHPSIHPCLRRVNLCLYHSVSQSVQSPAPARQGMWVTKPTNPRGGGGAAPAMARVRARLLDCMKDLGMPPCPLQPPQKPVRRPTPLLSAFKIVYFPTVHAR